MNVFDSSAIYKAIGVSNSGLLIGGYTVPLAMYELGNIVLKNTVLFHKYLPHEAQEVLKICEKTLDTMNVINPDDLTYVYQTAVRHQLSFYDAAYVCLAKKLNTALVTLDKKLQHKAYSIANIILFEDFIK